MVNGGQWLVRVLGEGIGHLLWPRLCLNCKTPTPVNHGTLCQSCWGDILACTAGQYCPTCGRDVSEYAVFDRRCPQCAGERFHFDQLLRCGVYDLGFRDMILAFKNGRTEMATLLGPMARNMLQGHPLASEIEVFVPVPLHWTRRMGRGYNQAQLLARALGSVGKPDLASSGPFSTWLHPAVSTIKPTSPASAALQRAASHGLPSGLSLRVEDGPTRRFC